MVFNHAYIRSAKTHAWACGVVLKIYLVLFEFAEFFFFLCFDFKKQFNLNYCFNFLLIRTA